MPVGANKTALSLVCVATCSLNWFLSKYAGYSLALILFLSSIGLLLTLKRQGLVGLLLIIIASYFQLPPGLVSTPDEFATVVTVPKRPKYGVCRLVVESAGGLFLVKTPDLPWNPACSLRPGQSFELGTYRTKVLEASSNPLSYGSYLRRRGISSIVYSNQPRVPKVQAQFEPLKPIAEREGYTVIAAAVLAQSDILRPDTEELFRRFGLSHVLVVSGFHVGVIYGLACKLFELLWQSSYWLCLRCPRQLGAPLLGLASVFGYSFLVGFQPTVIRAVAVLSIFVLSRVLGRSTSCYLSLLWSFLFLQLLWPGSFLELGVQLSYAALSSLALASVLIARLGKQSFPLRFLVDSSIYSLAAWMGTTPVLLLWLNEFAPLGALMNIWFTPLFSIVGICLGGAGLVFGGKLLLLAVAATELLLDILRVIAEHS